MTWETLLVARKTSKSETGDSGGHAAGFELAFCTCFSQESAWESC